MAIDDIEFGKVQQATETNTGDISILFKWREEVMVEMAKEAGKRGLIGALIGSVPGIIFMAIGLLIKVFA